jgi:hypothetical protein
VLSNIYALNFTKWFKSRLPLYGLLCAILLGTLTIRAKTAVHGRTINSALVAALARKGLAVDAEQVLWLSSEGGWFRGRQILFVARKAGEPEDVYYAEARVAGAGTIVDLSWLTNVTRTSSAVEGHLSKNGRYVAYGVRLGDSYDAVAVLDTLGEPADLTARWPFYARIQNRITNLQESGRSRGFGIQRYRLSPQAKRLTIEKQGRLFVVFADQERIVIDPASDRLPEHVKRLELDPMVKGQPGTITWVVDTIRNISWVGPGAVEWLEHTFFGITDRAARIYYGIVGDNTEAEVKNALKPSDVDNRLIKPVSTEKNEDIDIGWPPAPLKAVLENPVQGEGVWLPVIDADFVNANPNAPPAFYQTFIRVDPERRYTRVYVTSWDPRQVQLHIVSGTLEPKSATGETGTGLIPRDPETLRTLVGAFNGGFQALHGEFGMMAEGKVYIPPKPWSATVAVFEDGTVGIGSWPGPEKGGWSEQFAESQIPPNMISLRQNLTSVVEGGVYNPWKRWYWGAAPIWAKEQTYIHRSGVCLTDEGFFAYFWGGSMGPEELGKAMISVRCARGVMLDMNDKHTGFEFYRPYSVSSAPAGLGRELSDTEYDGPIENAPGFVFRARLAVNTMTPLRFPRYLRRDPRDFFYLTLKPVSPGPQVVLGGKTTKFSTAGLPREQWPYPFARSSIDQGRGSRIWLVRVDPKQAPPRTLASDKEGKPLAYLSGIERTAMQLQPDSAVPDLTAQAEKPLGASAAALFAVRQRGVGWRYAIGTPVESSRVLFWSKPLSENSAARAALGVDTNGFWVYAECERDHQGAAEPMCPTLRKILHQAGAGQALELPQGARLVFFQDGKTLSVTGEQGVRIDNENNLALIAEKSPIAKVLFPEVEPLPYRVWGWMQNQRVRYFPTGPPRFRTPGSVK